MHDSVKVQVSAIVAFGDQPPLQLDCVFVVLSKERVPNQRSGIILGQCSLLDRLQFRAIPRSVLRPTRHRRRGQTVDDDVWGDIQREGYASLFDTYIETCITGYVLVPG
jgi:hypothetical protein